MARMELAPSGDLRVLTEGGSEVLCLRSAPGIVASEGHGSLAVGAEESDGSFHWRGESEGLSFERHMAPSADGFSVQSFLRCRVPIRLIAFHDCLDVRVDAPRLVWTPNVCPEPGDVIGDHAWRSPVMIVHGDRVRAGLLPDLDVFGDQRHSEVGLTDWRYRGGEPPAEPPQIKAFMDTRRRPAGGRQWLVGFADYECRPHVYYRLTGRPVELPAGHELRIGYEVVLSEGHCPQDIRDYARRLWSRRPAGGLGDTLPQKHGFADYAAVSYRSVLATGDLPEFKTPDGGPAAGFRTSSTRTARDIASSYMKLPKRSVWFSAWFNSFRTAFGMKAWAPRLGPLGAEVAEKAERIKSLLLSAPDAGGRGLVPQIYDYEAREWWNAVPRLCPAGRKGFDLTAGSHTAMWMLRWHRHMEADDRLLDRARRLGAFLVSVQDESGAFPGFVDSEGRPLAALARSGQSGMASLMLCELCEQVPDARVLEAVERACRFYIEDLVPEGRFHDFEVFYSCSPKPLDYYDDRTGQHAENNLCIAWIAETLLRAARLTGREEYLEWGRRVLDRLSLYQQVWNPTFLKVRAFGGFGCQNTDGEWNDMRQVQFAAPYMRAYEQTGLAEDFERGVAALRSGYANYCHPDHEDINPVHYDTYPDGLMPENYAHGGNEAHAHRSGFDWGGGAIATMTALTGILYGDVFAHLGHGHAFGIDGCVVKEAAFEDGGASMTVCERTGRDRELDIVFADEEARRSASAAVSGGAETPLAWTPEELAALPLRDVGSGPRIG